MAFSNKSNFLGGIISYITAKIVKTKNIYRLNTTYLKTYDICNFTYTLFGVGIFYST